MMKGLMKGLGLGIIGLFLLGTSNVGYAKDKFEMEVEKEAEAVKLVRDVRQGGYDVVNTDELKKWMDAGKEMVIVDTMPYKDSYAKQHVPGAKQFLFPIPDMPAWDAKETDNKSEQDFAKILGPDKDKVIVIYCGFVKCTRSHNGALWAKKLGYKNVYRYPGGIFAWKGANYPSESVK
jgi:thiosulfate/3-mercaptopyruvate sulfurtransferase